MRDKIERTVAQTFATAIQAHNNCKTAQNDIWLTRWELLMKWLTRQFMPSGGGFDSGTNLDPSSNYRRLVFNTEYHHLNSNGYYTHWTPHVIRVWPDWQGFKLTISGRNDNDIKEYIHECFDCSLSAICHVIIPGTEYNNYGWYCDGKFVVKPLVEIWG
jgi:hypothetical protein